MTAPGISAGPWPPFPPRIAGLNPTPSRKVPVEVKKNMIGFGQPHQFGSQHFEDKMGEDCVQSDGTCSADRGIPFLSCFSFADLLVVASWG